MSDTRKKASPQVKKLSGLLSSIRRLVNNKYRDEFNSYTKRIINDIVYNEKAHIVATFKDYLILDDASEFLKR